MDIKQSDIQRLWEWCGLTHPWYSPYPDIDLNGLVKYAIPKLKVVTMTNCFNQWTVTINQGEMVNGKPCVIAEAKNLTDALYKAIMEVIDSEEKR